MTARFDEPRFLQLPESARRLLEFMSVICAPIAATPSSKPPSVAMDVKLLRPLLDEWVETGFLTRTGTGHYACAEEIRDELTRRSLREGRCSALAKEVAGHLSPDEPRHMWQEKRWPNVEAALRDLRLWILMGAQPYDLLNRTSRQYYNPPQFLPHPWPALWGVSAR